MGKWIKISEKFRPPMGELVWLYSKEDQVEMGERTSSGYEWLPSIHQIRISPEDCGGPLNPTHWMEIDWPEPPEEEE